MFVLRWQSVEATVWELTVLRQRYGREGEELREWVKSKIIWAYNWRSLTRLKFDDENT